MRTDLEWFRTFRAVFETGTMSDAAKELNISQPGVSLHLNALETYIGYPLFTRSTRKMIPNERAKMLYQEVIHALEKLEEVENSFRRKTKGGKRTVSIGMYPSIYRQFLEPHVSDIGFNLIMHLEHTEDLIPLLAHGTVDLAIINQDVTLRNVTYEKLGDTSFTFFAGSGTDTSAFEQIDRNNHKKVSQWLRSQTWYNTTDRSMLNSYWKLNFGKEPDFTPNYILPDMYSIILCLAGKSGIAVLPEFLCKEALAEGKLIRLWDGYVPMKNTLYFGFRKNTLLADEIDSLKAIIRKGFDYQSISTSTGQ